MTDPRTTAELANALDARAAVHEELSVAARLDAVAFEHENDATLHRAAAARLRADAARISAMDAALEPFAEAAKQFDPLAETFEVEGVGVFHENGHWSDGAMLRGHWSEGEADETTDDWICSVGDLRRARTARGES